MRVKRKVAFTDKNTDKKPVGWTVALADVEREMLNAKSRLIRLRNSAKIIRDKIRDGEPWPGTQAQE